MSDTLNWDELDHSDNWPDRTTREPEMVPSDEHKEFLAQLESDLNAKADDPEVQRWAEENLGENYPEDVDDDGSSLG